MTKQFSIVLYGIYFLSLQDNTYFEGRDDVNKLRAPLPSMSCILLLLYCFQHGPMWWFTSSETKQAGVITPIYRRGNWSLGGPMARWGHVASTRQSKACENNGSFNCVAAGRLVYVKLAHRDRSRREMEASAPEILGDSRILSYLNKETGVDSGKAYESLCWQNSLWRFECFMALSSQEAIT